MMDLPISVQIDLSATVPIPKPNGRYASDNIVVVDPSIVGNGHVVDESLVAHSRTAESM